MRAAAPAGLFLLALCVRSLPLPTVWAGDPVHFLGMDAYYHMRRILYGLERFPESLGFDPYINFPSGATAIWPPLFDGVATWIALPFYAAGGVDSAEQALVWLAPVLGSLTVVALYFLALPFLGFHVALAAGLILSVVSAHYWYSQVGFLDHHAAVALATTGLLAAAMVLLRSLDTSTEFPRGATLALGCAFAGNLLLWPGSLLHVGLIEAGLVVFALAPASAPDLRRRTRSLAAAQGIALVLLLPFCWNNEWAAWGDFSPTVLSHFQPWFFGAVGLYFLAAGTLVPGGPERGSRPFATVGVGLAILVLSATLLPGLREGALEAWQWLAKEEAFQASVLESRPLFQVRGKFSGAIAEGRLSYFIYILPAALLFLAWEVRRRTDRASLWLLLAWTAGLALVTLAQRRFFNSFSVALALVMAWTLVATARDFMGSSPSPGRRWGVAVTVTAFAIGLLLPMEASYRLTFSNLERALTGKQVLLRTAGPDFPALFETASWIRDNTPPTAGFLDASQAPAYGLLTMPGVGHLFEYRAQRPVVSDNFGDDIGKQNYEQVKRYFSTNSEAEAESIARELRARYVIATARSVRGPDSKSREILDRLVYDDGNGLAGMRLVFEASRLGANSRQNVPPPKVFERVPGAAVSGRAAPGQSVIARIAVRTNRGRQFTYRQQARTDSLGRYALRLPYASHSPAHPEATWRLESGGEKHVLDVGEAEVRDGRPVAGPSFGSPGTVR
ncbi:MAG: STT3 domain-containing protein [Myxococcota bacterium]|nr:STT3 domain-containing protein [Myxococcota bacterium]